MKEKTTKILNPPQLPDSIQGDGRQVLRLIKKFFGEVSTEINTINNVSGDNDSSVGTIATPEHFYLTFNKGGALFQWDKVIDERLLGYELRMNNKVGSNYGLLEFTTELKSTKIPLNRVGKIYLYAKNSAGEYSAPTVIEYAKPVPFSPSNVAVSKTPEGVLIYFDPIPDDCIGANVYVNQVGHTTETNLFLYTGQEKISQISLAYYDVFGQGILVETYFEPPDVTGFNVERNDNFLDFVWDNIPLYGVKYVIKRGATWDLGEFVGEIKTNDFSLNFPNTGDHTFWIKAVDEHGNYSVNATWATSANVPDIQRNVIFTLNQKQRQFEGTKVGMYYDEYNQAITMVDGVMRGEHIVKVNLPQKYRARNWINHTLVGVSDFDITWGDANFAWGNLEANTSWSGDLTLEGSTLKHQIARHTGMPANVIDAFRLDNNTSGEKGIPSQEHKNISYNEGRFSFGSYISDLSRLSWQINIPSIFSSTFVIKLTSGLNDDIVFMTLQGDSGRLFLGFDKTKRCFYLQDHLGKRVEAVLDYRNSDFITFGVVQTSNKRKLYVHSFSTNAVGKDEQVLAPVGSFTDAFLYCKTD
ncbi:MAG: hypothetical protein LBR56_03810 [Sporomusaceae bacterium]|nr:hypothetical protein [Sporomusaceae bacterium]